MPQYSPPSPIHRRDKKTNPSRYQLLLGPINDTLGNRAMQLVIDPRDEELPSGEIVALRID